MAVFHRWLRKPHASHVLAIALIAAVAVAAGFMLARQSADDLPVAANPGEEREPFWYEPLLREDREKPRLDGVINGIRIGVNAVVDTGGLCEAGRARYVDPGEASGTVLEIRTAYLPVGTFITGELVVRCGPDQGTLIHVERQFTVPAAQSIGRYGGRLSISRYLISGTPTANLSIPEERARGSTVAGHPAVIVMPLTDDGFGDSAIVIREEDRVTRIVAVGITEAELVSVAEGLYR